MATQTAFRLALLAFTAESLRGLLHGSTFTTTAPRALTALVAFYILGWVFGLAAEWLIDEQAQQEFERLKSASEPTPQQSTAA